MNIIKILVTAIIMLLMGCQQLINGQQQPVKLLKDNMLMTTCGGAVETWGSCNDRAMSKCKNGYEVMRKNEDSTGMIRELIFKCK